MQRTLLIALFAFMALMTTTLAQAAGDTYFAIKGGAFLPNGASNGFGGFGTGYNAEVAAGIRPEPYVAVELGGGYYATSHAVTDYRAPSKTDFDAYSIPVTLTAKGILSYDKLELFAGAGLGYWFSQLKLRTQNLGNGALLGKTSNAGAFGWQVVAGADYRVSDSIDLGLETKWCAARPEFDLTQAGGPKTKFEVGGTIINAVMKYRF